MDNSLMQLERELFSLTPSEPGRRLSAHLERAVCTPVQIPRRVPSSASSGVLPFQWKRVVVPAAAAVAVVAVMSGAENSSRSSVNAQAGTGLAVGPARETSFPASALFTADVRQPVSTRPVSDSSREPLTLWPSSLTPASGTARSLQQFESQDVERHLWFNPETNSFIELSVPRRVVQPVVRFH